MSDERTTVFISYAHSDGVAVAQRLETDLRNDSCDVWLDERRLSAGSTWSKDIESGLDGADIVIALLTPGSYVSEICRAEQLRALRKGKCVIPVLAHAHAEVPLYLEAKQYVNLCSSSRYADEVTKLLERIRARSGTPLKPRYQQTYVTAPPLPMNYIERAEPLERLRNTLLADGSKRHIALTAFCGTGGIGKTELAQAICHDEVVQQAFPDGVLWVGVGKEQSTSLLTRMREVAKGLGDQLDAYDTDLGATHRYRSVLCDKAALIVLDDIWNVQDVEPFRAESRRSRVLFTTRDASIAAAAGASEHIAELLNEQQSRVLLAEWTGRQSESLPRQAPDLITECGRLPLALAVVGALMRGATTEEWQGTLELVRKADIRAFEEQLPPGQSSFIRAVQVTVEALAPAMQPRYKISSKSKAARPPAIVEIRSFCSAGECSRRNLSASCLRVNTTGRAGCRALPALNTSTRAAPELLQCYPARAEVRPRLRPVPPDTAPACISAEAVLVTRAEPEAAEASARSVPRPFCCPPRALADTPRRLERTRLAVLQSGRADCGCVRTPLHASPHELPHRAHPQTAHEESYPGL